MRFTVRILGVVAACAAAAGLWVFAGLRGPLPVVRDGGTYWLAVTPTSPLLTPAMRVALASNAAPTSGRLAWQAVDEGFEVADLPVLMSGAPVEHLLLARIDPAHFRFAAHNAVSGQRDLDRWLARTGAALIVNGSFFSRQGEPATPFLSASTQLGPKVYDAKAGAFVSSPASISIHDLAHEDWRVVFQGATDAMVSYPLLLSNGVSRVTKPTRWLATRSFVGQDASGRIIVGTTTDAFFSLARLAQFLLDAPLDLTIALNLDGGPVACQGIVLGDYRRMSYGRSEARVEGDEVQLLMSLPNKPAQMPVVLAAVRRTS
ncbi:MAG: phosphodiester glycosidase family protein [Pseudomonadota bacterium]